MDLAGTGMLHHLELWVPDLTKAEVSWGWLLEKMGYRIYQQWPEGQSWRAGVTYIVIEQSPDRVAGRHHGWRLLYPDRHPYAGGVDHYAAYLENRDGYEVELVAPANTT